jgi:hypothetical protein
MGTVNNTNVIATSWERTFFQEEKKQRNKVATSYSNFFLFFLFILLGDQPVYTNLPFSTHTLANWGPSL